MSWVGMRATGLWLIQGILINQKCLNVYFVHTILLFVSFNVKMPLFEKVSDADLFNNVYHFVYSGQMWPTVRSLQRKFDNEKGCLCISGHGDLWMWWELRSDWTTAAHVRWIRVLELLHAWVPRWVPVCPLKHFKKIKDHKREMYLWAA